MGNCSLKGVVGNIGAPVRVMTDAGEVMKFEGPIQVQEVVNDHKGYGIFRKDRLSSPLVDDEQLLNGQLYYLLPLKKNASLKKVTSDWETESTEKQMSPRVSSSDFAMNNLRMDSALRVFPTSGNDVWKVKMVFDTKQLEEIFSEQVNIEALIEKMRMVASSTDATTPRRMKIPWVVHWKTSVSNLIKVSPKLSKE